MGLVDPAFSMGLVAEWCGNYGLTSYRNVSTLRCNRRTPSLCPRCLRSNLGMSKKNWNLRFEWENPMKIIYKYSFEGKNIYCWENCVLSCLTERILKRVRIHVSESLVTLVQLPPVLGKWGCNLPMQSWPSCDNLNVLVLRIHVEWLWSHLLVRTIVCLCCGTLGTKYTKYTWRCSWAYERL